MADLHLEKARAWLLTAQSDLESARLLGNAADPKRDTAVYHCQQTAEKAVKAFLVAHGQAFEKVHDVERLVAQAAKLHPDFSRLAVPAAELTPLATAYRYPDETGFLRPTREEFDEALRHAQSIYEFVLNLLPAQARP
jgi:HEPN domain-containing protein